MKATMSWCRAVRLTFGYYRCLRGHHRWSPAGWTVEFPFVYKAVDGLKAEYISAREDRCLRADCQERSYWIAGLNARLDPQQFQTFTDAVKRREAVCP